MDRSRLNNSTWLWLSINLVMIMQCLTAAIEPTAENSTALDATDREHVLSDDSKYQNSADGRDYLIKYGYMKPPDTITGGLVSFEDFKASIRQFQAMIGLDATGEIDEITLKMMNQPRCGVSDKLGTNRFNTRKKRYDLQGSVWRKRSLKYFVESVTTQQPSEDVLATLRNAWQIWTVHANIAVSEVEDKLEADMLISFSSYSHGDSFPFDGRGGVLAHAFFPERGGDIHFDDMEQWVLGPGGGTDLLFAATHEFGHSLGLAHSDVFDSIMAPIYRGHVPGLQLNQDDIKALQSLYGKKTTVNVQTVAEDDSFPAHQPTSAEIDLCQDPSIDGITTTLDGNTYVFKGIYYWKLDTIPQLKLARGYPRRISDTWQGLRGNIDTVFTDYSGNTFIIKDRRYWHFNNTDVIVGNRPVSERFVGLPGRVDAIFTWSGNGKIYAIKGSFYYRLLDNGTVAQGYPRDITIWKGLPYGRIDAAINFQNSRTYFFSGRDYYRYNDRLFDVDQDYPLKISDRWYGCSGNLISYEGQYNQQWLEVDEDGNSFPQYPTDVKLGSKTTSSGIQFRSTIMSTVYGLVLMITISF